jgi:hypothetical protein
VRSRWLVKVFCQTKPRGAGKTGVWAICGPGVGGMCGRGGRDARPGHGGCPAGDGRGWEGMEMARGIWRGAGRRRRGERWAGYAREAR